MALGLPVVGTAVGGIPEMIEDGVDGVLVDYGDENGMASSIERLITDSNLRDRLGHAARIKAQAKFTSRTYCENVWREVSQFI